MNIFWLAIKKKKLCFPGFIGELAFWNHHLIKLVLIIVNSENLYHVFFVGKKYFSWVFLYCFVYIYTKEILRFSAVFFMKKKNAPLREKSPNRELFLVYIFLYSVRIQENTDQN